MSLQAAPEALPPRPDTTGSVWPWATWELHETLAVAMAPFGVALVATIAVLSSGAQASGWIVVLTLVQQLALGLGTWWWVRVHTGTVTGLGLRHGGSRGRDIGAGVAAGLGAVVASGLVIQITQQLTGTTEIANPLEAAGEAWVLPNALLALALAPVCEEIAFRGFLFGGLRRRMRFVWAALASGILFGLIHGDPVRMPGLTLAGFILAAVYERRKTLRASMSAHATINVIAVLGYLSLR